MMGRKVGREAILEDYTPGPLLEGEKAARRKCGYCGSSKSAWEPYCGENSFLRCRVCGNEWVPWPK
jgi:hypothetical protein